MLTLRLEYAHKASAGSGMTLAAGGRANHGTGEPALRDGQYCRDACLRQGEGQDRRPGGIVQADVADHDPRQRPRDGTPNDEATACSDMVGGTAWRFSPVPSVRTPVTLLRRSP
jgi:hypothetical protein